MALNLKSGTSSNLAVIETDGSLRTVLQQPIGLKSGTSSNLAIVEADGSLRTTDMQPARTPVQIFGTALAVGNTGVETLLTLSQVRGLVSGSGSSFTVTAGKKLNIQSLVFTQIGNATATVATSIFRMRYNPAGAATVASTPIILQTRLTAPASALSFTQAPFTFSGGWELPGDGVASFAFTVTSTYATNTPTADVMLVGYEY